ncbi:MAG: hypothetical protein EP315_07870 [Gammaproteobacteria bacterium]|nr:MAG: hypothetical protein EP315_07870 [Gammaproteobacteria bacterium]
MSADHDDKLIPTLTDIIEAGEDDMLHHFDTGAFADMQTVPRYQTLDENELRNIIESLVDEVVDDMMPSIKQQLKQQISDKLLAELGKPLEQD